MFGEVITDQSLNRSERSNVNFYVPGDTLSAAGTYNFRAVLQTVGQTVHDQTITYDVSRTRADPPTILFCSVGQRIAYEKRGLDVAPDDLCGAEPGRALGASVEWHSEVLDGLTIIPKVEPGDTVWWHPDVIHSVADEHSGSDYANVIYIGASPKCQKNEVYARRQAEAFLAGRSAPDFAPEDYEVDFEGRATVDDLTELGRAQMCM